MAQSSTMHATSCFSNSVTSLTSFSVVKEEPAEPNEDEITVDEIISKEVQLKEKNVLIKGIKFECVENIEIIIKSESESRDTSDLSINDKSSLQTLESRENNVICGKVSRRDVNDPLEYVKEEITIENVVLTEKVKQETFESKL